MPTQIMLGYLATTCFLCHNHRICYHILSHYPDEESACYRWFCRPCAERFFKRTLADVMRETALRAVHP